MPLHEMTRASCPAAPPFGSDSGSFATTSTQAIVENAAATRNGTRSFQ